MQVISYSEARNSLKSVLDAVNDNVDVTIINRRDAGNAKQPGKYPGRKFTAGDQHPVKRVQTAWPVSQFRQRHRAAQHR